MSNPPAPDSAPEPQFIALMRRLGIGTLTFDVPRMGQQGYVPVSEFLTELDGFIEAKAAVQAETMVADRVAAALAEQAAPATLGTPTLTDLVGPPPGIAADPLVPVQQEGLVRVSFWSNVEDRIVVRYVDSLDAELAEWVEDPDAPLYSADVLVAFGDVTDERLVALTSWAHNLLEEDVVAYAGPPNLTTPGLIAENPDRHVDALDGIEEVLGMQVERTGDPRENFLPPVDPREVPIPDFSQMPGMEDMPEGFRQIIDMVAQISAMAAGEGTDLLAGMFDQRPAHDDTPLEGDLFEIEADAFTAALRTAGLNATVTVHLNVAQVTFPDPYRIFSVEAAGTKMAVASHQTGFRHVSETVNVVPVTHDTLAAAIQESIWIEDGPEDVGKDGYPERPAYTPIEGGPGTTEPFAVILTDPGDWPYNDAFTSDDAAVLHRIEHDQSMPHDEVLQDVSQQMTSVSNQSSDSEGKWWASVNKALDEAGIPEDRRHEGITY